MPIKIKLSDDLKNLLDQNKNSGLIPRFRKKFVQQRSPARIKREILKDINRGISPVKGKGKWKRYSQSYKDAIRGRTSFVDPVTGEYIIFRYVNGRVIKIDVETRNIGETQVQRDANPTKRVSPVNLRLSGGLHKSLTVEAKNGFLRGFRLRVAFSSELANIHNKLGAGKSKVIRRLLPTESGEEFNLKINSFIFDEVQKAVDSVVKELDK